MSFDFYQPIRLNNLNHSLQEEVNAACDTDIELCMECGKCSGGCSNAHIFDYTPRKIVQLVKIGAEDTLMNMDALWTCVSCHLCVDRCPSQINIPRIMDYLREKAYHQGIKSRRANVELFHKLMLDSIKHTGKVNETTLMLKYNLTTKQYLKDAGLGSRMLFKGKLSPFSIRVREIKPVSRLFVRTPVHKEV